MKRVSLITGVSGQDGSYLSEFLIDKEYEVHGLVAYGRRELCPESVTLHYADLTDASAILPIINDIGPTEVYHLGAQSHVRLSFDLPLHTADVTGLGTLRMLEAIRQYQHNSGQQVKFYQASSSEMFGKVAETPQSESTPFHPRSPYACAKLYAHWQTINYREAYGMFTCNGILFNHESPRRGKNFVTRKITRAAARIKLGLQDKLYLGNLSAKRDWGFAGDYVEAMWLMLQQDIPDDYVIATGETHTVQEFLEEVFAAHDLDWRDYVETDPKLLRPSEVDILCGDAAKARRVLNWEPKVTFRELAQMMALSDLKAAEQERARFAAPSDIVPGSEYPMIDTPQVGDWG